MPEEINFSQLILSPIIQAPDHSAALSAIEKIFSLSYTYLQPFFQPAWAVFTKLKKNHLIEQNTLIDEIDSFINASDRGVLVLEGPGGSGKTTLLGQWTNHSAPIHHFFEMGSGYPGVQAGKSSLGAQFIRVCGLADWMPLNQFTDAVHSPNFLNELFAEGSKRIRQTNPDQKICIVLDGLEETGVSLDQNPLGLAERPPENVFWILSQTPNLGSLNFRGNVKIIRLGQASALNNSALHTYCQNVLEDSGYESVRNRVGTVRLCEILLSKAGNNWLHLDQLLHLLKDPGIIKLPPDELFDDLPDNLFKSYLRAFLNIKDTDHADWYRFLLPALGVLAAFPRPISIPLLALHTSLPADPRQLKNHIDQFLSSYLTLDFQERYQLDHFLLKEFFLGHLVDGDLTSQEEAFLLELTENSRLSHLRFAQEILSTWGGLKEGLPGLEASEELSPQEEYGLDYLVTHLEGSGSIEEIKKLLNLEWVSDKNKRPKSVRVRTTTKRVTEARDSVEKTLHTNSWYAAKRSHNRLPSYLDDIRKAWKINTGIGDQVCYALILSSIRTMISKPEDGVIGDLDEQDQWVARLAACLAEAGEPGEAFAAVETIQHDRWKSQALAEIATYLPSNSIPAVMRLSQNLQDYRGKNQIISNCALHLIDLSKPIQSLEIAQRIPETSQRKKTLTQLASVLMDTDQAELSLEAIHLVEDESVQVGLINRIAKNLDRETLQIAMTMVKAFHNDERKVHALIGLAPYLPLPLQRECFQWLQSIKEDLRSQALVGLIPYVHESTLKDGIASVREIKDENLRAPVLEKLIIRMAAISDPEKAFQLIPAILGEKYKAPAICGIAPYLSEDQRKEALEWSRGFKDETCLAQTQSGLVPYLDEPVLQEILDGAALMKNRVSQGVVISAILKRYHALGEPTKSLEFIRQCPSQDLRSKLLVEMAPLWSESMKKEVLEITLDLELKDSQALALIALLPHLSTADLLTARSTALELPHQGWLGSNRRQEILCEIALLLASKGEFEESLSILDAFQDDDELYQAIRQIFPVLLVDPQAKMYLAVQRIKNLTKRISLLGEVASSLSPTQFEEALSELDQMDEQDRLEAIPGLAPSIPVNYLQNFIPRVLEIQDKNLRAQTLTAVVQKWVLLPVPESLNLWKNTILILSNRPRPDFLLDISTLSPVINDLGGVSAIKETLQALKDVIRWWN